MSKKTSSNDQEMLPIRIREVSLPGRINTDIISDYEGEPGHLCSGCREVVSHPLAACFCPEWHDFINRMTVISEEHELEPNDTITVEETFIAKKVKLDEGI